jgi:putative inorganic carbon (HCO3(-)) transporter
MRALIILFIVGVGVLAAMRSRFAALALYVWFALFRPQEWAHGDITPWHLSVISGLALAVPALFTGLFGASMHPLNIGSFAFLGTALVAQLHAGNQTVGWEKLKVLIPLVVVCWLTTTLLSSRTRIVRFMAVVGVSLGIHGAYTGAWFAVRGGGHLTAGPGGAFDDNNAFALGVVRIMFFLLFAGQWIRPRFVRPVLYAMLPLCLLTIVWSYSRGAFLALAAGALAFAVFQRRQLRAVAAVVALGAVAYGAIPSDYGERLGTISSYDEEFSAASRLHFWDVAVAMVKQRPLGVGLGNFESEYDTYDSSDGLYGHSRAVHSSHMQALSETGIVGFLIFEGLNGYSLFALWRIRRQAIAGAFGDPEKDRFFLTIGGALFASTAAFLVGGSFLSQALNDLNWLTFAIVGAVQRAAVELLEDAKAETPAATALPLLDASAEDSFAARHAASTAITPISGV